MADMIVETTSDGRCRRGTPVKNRQGIRKRKRSTTSTELDQLAQWADTGNDPRANGSLNGLATNSDATAPFARRLPKYAARGGADMGTATAARSWFFESAEEPVSVPAHW